MTKRLLLSGLVCLLLTSPFFVSRAYGESDSITVTLDDLFQMADANCQQIKVSESALKAANDNVKQAKNTLLPHLNINLSGSYIGDATLMTRGFSTSGTTDVIVAGLGPQSVENGRQETPHWGNNFSFEASQVLYAGGAMKAGVEIAKIGERMAELDVAKNRQDVRFMLVGYYLDLVKLQNQLDVVDRHIKLTEQVIENMRAREQAGTILQNDLTRYELQLKQLDFTRIQLASAQSIIQYQLQTTLHATNVLKPDTLAIQADYNQVESELAEAIWHTKANENNIGIQQVEMASQISEKQIKTTRAASIPTIALVAKDELFGPYTSDLIPVNANVNVWFVGIGVSYDLGSLWHNNRAIKKAQNDFETSKAQTQLVRENIDNQVHAAYVDFLTAFAKVDTEEKQVELANQNYSVVENRYNNDLALLTDLLDASNIKLSADMELVNARISLLYHYYRLKYISNLL